MSPSGGKLVCNNCNYSVNPSEKNSGQIVSRSTSKEVIMIKEEKSVEPLDSEAVCSKCKHVGAYYLLKQNRSADEPETKFYTCASCGHRWRE